MLLSFCFFFSFVHYRELFVFLLLLFYQYISSYFKKKKKKEVWDLRFFRAFEDWELTASYFLLQFIQPHIPWGDRRDTLCWQLKGNGKFDT